MSGYYSFSASFHHLCHKTTLERFFHHSPLLNKATLVLVELVMFMDMNLMIDSSPFSD